MMFDWLRETISDPTGFASSKRIALLMAAGSMSLAVVILSVAACYGHDVALALGAVATPLAGMGGWSYTAGVKKEATK